MGTGFINAPECPRRCRPSQATFMVSVVASKGSDTMGLTVKAVESAKLREKGYKLSDGRGAKSWRPNHTLAGKQKTRTQRALP